MSTSRNRADGSTDPLKPQLLDLLRDTTAYAATIGETAMADTDLTLSSSGLLSAICLHPGITIAQLAREIPKTAQTIGQVVARLHKLKLIERQLADGRGIALFPTESGRHLAKVAETRELQIERRLQDILGLHQYKQVISVLTGARSALRVAATAAE